MSGASGKAPQQPIAVASRGLTKLFGRTTAVDHIDLAVPAGSVFGFLGPNGSGKTTTIRMLLGLVRPSSGTANLLGRRIPGQVERVLPQVGSLVEGPAFHPYLSGWRNLARVDAADASSDPRTMRNRVGAALERVGLTAAARKNYRVYSLGMRQRLAIASALLRPRRLLVLDEPTNGLDPQGTREVRHLVSDLAGDGTTVLISSHLLGEVEQVCTHVGVMHRGRLVAQDSLNALRAATSPMLTLVSPDTGVASEVLRRMGMSGIEVVGERISARPGSVATEDVVIALVREGARVREIGVQAPSLEQMFVGLTGEGFDVS